PTTLVPTAVPTAAPVAAAGFGSPVERRAAAREQARLAAERARARRRPGSPLLTSAVLGLALLAAGAVVVVGLLTTAELDVLPLALAAAVAVMALGAVLAGVRGRRTALVGLAWPLAVLALAASVVPPASGWTWQLDRTWQPAAGGGASSVVGWLRVDPADLGAGEPATATIAAGRLDVLVPEGATVLLDVQVLAGSVRWEGSAQVVELDADDERGVRGRVTAGGVRDGDVPGSRIDGGVNRTRVFAVGPDAAALAEDVRVRGGDPEDWTVPAGTPELRAVAWTGEVRVGAAGGTLLEAS
ncbi:hypothetical protein GTQ99_21035, partial [Kineococcus sp. T13]|uniref:hypothetical protein n=1 Tax=Kineococcus vitellinus TaxID=2696565 RepID=UPI001412372C